MSNSRVIVADSNLCTSQSADVFVSYPACLPTGVEEISELVFAIYPITITSWQLIMGHEYTGCEIEIIDAIGQSVLKSAINNQQSEIDVSRFSSGIYFVRVYNNDKKFSMKKILKP